MGQDLTIIDLENYDQLDSIIGANLAIRSKPVNGIELPVIYYKLTPEALAKLEAEKPKTRKKKPVVTIDVVNKGAWEDGSKLEWTPGISIDTKCKPKDYIAIIAWWFGQMTLEENAYYPKQLEESYPGIDLRAAVKKIRNDLEHYHTHTCTQAKNGPVYTERITRIDQKITTMLRKYTREGWYKKKG